MPNTNNQRIPLYKIEDMDFKKVSADSYQFDFIKNPLPVSIEVLGHYMVTYNDLFMDCEHGQIRANDYDKAHVEEQKQGYIRRVKLGQTGIETWLVGWFNPKTGKINLLDGHHRARTVIGATMECPQSSKNVPIMVISFDKDKPETLSEWLSPLNINNTPSKPPTNKDAIKHFAKHHQKYFSQLPKNATEEQKRKHIYDIMSRTHSNVKSTAKKRVYDEAIGGNHEDTRTIGDKESETIQERNWGKTREIGRILNDTCYISSRYDPSRKTIMMKCIERSEELEDKPDKNQMHIRIITWFPSNANFDSRRKEALRVYTAMNNYVIKENLAKVSEVVFAEQDKTKDINQDHVYVWDFYKNEFV